MKKIIAVLSISFLVVIAFDSQAQNREDKRQKAQQVRIAQGTASGDLTVSERRALKKQQRHIRRTERRAESDGVVTPREKAKIERKQDRASRNIRRVKNNSRSRGGN